MQQKTKRQHKDPYLYLTKKKHHRKKKTSKAEKRSESMQRVQCMIESSTSERPQSGLDDICIIFD